MPEFQPADESDAATTPAAGDALFALALEATETRQRARLGGWFYLGGWVLVCVAAGFGDAVAWAVGAAMAALAVARYLLPAAGDDTLDGLQRALHWSWAVALSSAALWGVVAVVVATDARFEAARPIALFATVAYATAFAHSFPMRRGLSLLAIALIYLPSMAAFASTDRIALATAMGVYLLYVVLALLRSHLEYRQRLALDAELRHQRDRYELQSRRDGLTGLANRRRFVAALAERVARAVGHGAGFALLILDLDQFKAVNDRHGHAVGDECLAEVGARLRAQFGGAGELPVRLGGEEFGVLLDGHDAAAAMARAEAFRAALAERPIAAGGQRLVITTSIGVGVFEPTRHADGDALYREADQALYRAKAEGRNRACLAATR